MEFDVQYTDKEIWFIRQRIQLGDVPRFLCKYRSVKSAIEFLGNRSIYFSNYTEFNDPFESSANYRVDYTPQQFYEFFISIGFNPTSANEVTQQIADGIIDGRTCLKEMTEKALLSIGYYCMSSNPDNLLMWAHYADCHRGVCLMFDILEDLDSFLVPLPVEYNSDYMDYDTLNSNLTDLIRRKSKDWSYENEYRIIKTNFHGPKKVKRTALKKIIFGCRIRKEDKDSIMKEASLSGFNDVTFSEAKMNSHAYGLIITRID